MKTISCDVLILGGGSAGLWAAYSCAQARPDAQIVIVDKGPKDWGGLMTMAGGDFEAVLDPDTVDQWIQDFVYYFDGLCDQKLMEEILTRSRDRLADYERFGCEFFRMEDGKRKFVRQRGLDHVKLYPAQLKGRGGELMVKNLVRQLQECKVQRLGRILLGTFLRQGDRVCGALGFDTITGEQYRFDAKVVIAASGMGGWKTSYGKNTPTGETMQMAWEAGAILQNMEFARVWNMPRYFGWEGQTVLMPLGARFVNRNGESFMDRYSPVLGPNTDPHYTTIAMAMEVRAGRGPITFDLSRIQQENLILLRPQNGWQKLNYDKLSDLGMDLFRDSTEWVPQMTVAYGGLRADAWGNTGVPGLLAAGTARATEPGVYAGGFALMTTSVLGHMAGENAARLLDETQAARPDTDVDAEMARLFEPMGRTGLFYKDVLHHIQSVVFPYDVSIIKTEESLARARKELLHIIENEVPAMAAADPHYLLKLIETRAVAFVSLMYVTASLERRETRAGHYREDYPTRNENDLAWLCLKRNGSDTDPEFYRVPVPLAEYRFPVTRYYQDNFNFSE
ncbi:MAG TPA: FAD-binding protein [Candidatus Desulfovibrio intestinipullorum]|uniref:FAD-binding protein n=1 Tax=Candidatus Desulfovibrio intestinipullorum TaxID=2838536 RepID=A0A9D1TPK3_9BACT|nr:FAD-binding protein [Candidatus Desulfovibrio intestinipullorum]